MFEKYGKMNSVEELNEKAAEMLVMKNYEGIKALAKENGIDNEDAEDFIDGVITIFATPYCAATGRLEIESAELKPYEIMEDWVSYIKATVLGNPNMCEAIMKKDKSLKGCIAELVKWSMKNAKPVDADILKACNINYKVTLGIPGIRTSKKLIKEYYLGGANESI